MFTIDQVNGEIKVANKNFQRKAVPQYELNFSVTDGGKLQPELKWTKKVFFEESAP